MIDFSSALEPNPLAEALGLRHSGQQLRQRAGSERTNVDPTSS
jgi:hypothetical protein